MNETPNTPKRCWFCHGGGRIRMSAELSVPCTICDGRGTLKTHRPQCMQAWIDTTPRKPARNAQVAEPLRSVLNQFSKGVA